MTYNQLIMLQCVMAMRRMSAPKTVTRIVTAYQYRHFIATIVPKRIPGAKPCNGVNPVNRAL
jgi:hypothetical protein